jgi:hypothetical protein
MHVGEVKNAYKICGKMKTAWEIKFMFGGRFKMDLAETGCGWNLAASGQGSALFNKWQ